MTIDKFWNFSKGEEGGRVLRFDGVISQDSWWGDEITPAQFRSELFAEDGDVTVWINSPGGDCIAASQIYTMLMDYKGNVTVKIDGCAYSAASVIAMAGTQVLMAPTALMMIHNPWSIAIGDSEEMLKASAMLDNVKEAIMNAYEIKTGMGRVKLSNLMDAESFFPVQKAIELGFADGMLADEKQIHPNDNVGVENYIFSRRTVNNSLMNKVLASVRGQKGSVPLALQPAKTHDVKPQGIPVESLTQRLNLIQH